MTKLDHYDRSKVWRQTSLQFVRGLTGGRAHFQAGDPDGVFLADNFVDGTIPVHGDIGQSEKASRTVDGTMRCSISTFKSLRPGVSRFIARMIFLMIRMLSIWQISTAALMASRNCDLTATELGRQRYDFTFSKRQGYAST
jgi:hypothetical protein